MNAFYAIWSPGRAYNIFRPDHISVSAREDFALLGHLSLPPKFRFPAGNAESPRDRFAFEQRRVRQRRDVGVCWPKFKQESEAASIMS